MRTTRRHAPALVATLAIGAALGACSDSSGRLGSSARLSVKVTNNTSARETPLALTFNTPAVFTVDIVAQKADGTVDTGFNGFVRVSIKPGSVVSLTGENTSGRNVRLTGGVANGLTLGALGAFGDTHIWAEDIGYVPADPARKPPPMCSNGVDDNGNGVIDFPADFGCAFANDDDENGGGYASGASESIFFTLPRIADVRGYSLGGTGTAFPHQQIQVDTGWRPNAQTFEFNTVITRVAADGFYATDTGDKRGFSSIFAFNFSAPPRMRVCDRMKAYGGTASDFFGFTEVGFPTWELEEWDPRKRDCLVPEPYAFKIGDLASPPAIANTPALSSSVSSLVRMITEGTVTIHVSSKFGPGFPPAPADVLSGLTPPGPMDLRATENNSNCDINKDGKVDFATEPEKTCSALCTADPECTEFSNYASRGGFRLVLTDTNVTSANPDGEPRAILADASTAAGVDPVMLRGKTIKSFSGTLRYFSGGSQYTIEARCDDDIIVDPNGTPVAANTACVHPRSDADLSGSN